LKRRLLADLIEYPVQEQFFGNYGEGEYELLLEDIRRNGLKVPIDVLPADNAAGLDENTMLGGHTRRRALLEIGEEYTVALVRYDLAGESRDALDLLFLLDNTARRQMTPFERGRAAVRMFQIERKALRGDDERHPLGAVALREKIGKIFGITGRNLLRYFHVLAAPPEIQRAFEGRKIKLVEAEKVGALPPRERAKIAERLKKGETPETLVAELSAGKAAPRPGAKKVVAALVRSLEKAESELEGRLEELSPKFLDRYAAELTTGKRLLRKLIEKKDAEA